jgi:hypothetical protein
VIPVRYKLNLCYVEESRPLWSSGQKVRVQFPALRDFLKSSGSGTGPLCLVSTIEELLERKI